MTEYTRRELEEELYRRLIRRSVSALAVHLGHNLAAHHRLMCAEIELALATPNARLVLTAPPGAAKSRYATQIAPVSWLARATAPGGQGSVLVGTHTAGMATLFGERARRIVQENSELIGYGVDPSTSAKDRWNTTTGREYFAVGVGQGIAGIRAGLGILDDLYPTREDAESEAYREKVMAWIMDDFDARLTPGAPMILVNTRWHEDDHIARLERVWKQAGTPYRIVNIRAYAEADDPLQRALGAPLGLEWVDDTGQPYGYPDLLARKRAEMTAESRVREFEAMYQGRPSPETGDYFQRAWFIEGKPPPRDHLRIVGASDYAVTDGGGDWTVHVVVGIDTAGRLWVLDLWRGRTSSDKWIEAFCDLVLKWRPQNWAEESGQIRASLGPYIAKRMLERKAYVVRTAFPSRNDKAIRAQSIRAAIASAGLHLPAGAPWAGELIHEMMSFPAGKNDDQVDALSLIGQLMLVMNPARMPANQAPEPMRGIEAQTIREIFALDEQP